ncbi:MAG: hypothetical protein GTO02_05805 [Candidatus Dadabacteria bacterium]|nr:hypothetical protein [Candidatus Dadabacteria bacterium]
MIKSEKDSQILTFFNVVINYVFKIILLFLLFGIIVGTVKLFFPLGELVTKDITGSYETLITDVLTLYILIEIARIFAEYFNTNRLRMTYLVDAAIAFILRDILIMLYSKHYTDDTIYALAVMILILGLLRVAFILLFQKELRMNKKFEKE